MHNTITRPRISLKRNPVWNSFSTDGLCQRLYFKHQARSHRPCKIIHLSVGMQFCVMPRILSVNSYTSVRITVPQYHKVGPTLCLTSVFSRVLVLGYIMCIYKNQSIQLWYASPTRLLRDYTVFVNYFQHFIYIR